MVEVGRDRADKRAAGERETERGPPLRELGSGKGLGLDLDGGAAEKAEVGLWQGLHRAPSGADGVDVDFDLLRYGTRSVVLSPKMIGFFDAMVGETGLTREELMTAALAKLAQVRPKQSRVIENIVDGIPADDAAVSQLRFIEVRAPEVFLQQADEMSRELGVCWVEIALRLLAEGRIPR